MSCCSVGVVSLRILPLFGVAATVVSASAELLCNGTLEEEIEQTRYAPYRAEGIRSFAINCLGTWPSVSDQDELRIGAALRECLNDESDDLKRLAIRNLAVRRHREIFPDLFELLRFRPDLFKYFFECLPDPKNDPPVALLKDALRGRYGTEVETQRNGKKSTGYEHIRAVVTHVIWICKVTELIPELEQLADQDPVLRPSVAFALLKLAEGGPHDVLLRRIVECPDYLEIGNALHEFDGDADLQMLLPLLAAKDLKLKEAVLNRLENLKVENARPICDAMVSALANKPPIVPLTAIRTLGHYCDGRAIKLIRDLLIAKQIPRPFLADDIIVRAVRDIGGKEAVALLNDMLNLGFDDNIQLHTTLARFGDPSSGRAIWPKYLANPIRYVPNAECVRTRGYDQALRVLKSCADAKLLAEIRERARSTEDRYEKRALEEVATDAEKRLNQHG